jgi:hypothetical protein
VTGAAGSSRAKSRKAIEVLKYLFAARTGVDVSLHGVVFAFLVQPCRAPPNGRNAGFDFLILCRLPDRNSQSRPGLSFKE